MSTKGIYTIIVGVLIVLALIFQPIRCTRIDASHEGILVRNYGTDRGIYPVSQSTGWVWFNTYTTKVHEFPNFIQNRTYTRGEDDDYGNEEFVVTAKDGMNVSFDVALTYNITPGKAPKIFSKYRKDLQELESTTFRTYMRESYQKAAENFNATELYEKRAEFETIANKNIRDKMEKDGFQIESSTILNELRMPENVVSAITEKVKATQIAQQKQQEILQVRADSAKKVIAAAGHANSILIEAQAQSKANELLQQSLTPMLIEKMRIEQWNGVYPTTMLGGNAAPLIQLK